VYKYNVRENKWQTVQANFRYCSDLSIAAVVAVNE